MALAHERPDLLDELYMFHPVHTFINKTVTDFEARPILQDIYVEGKRVYQLPDLKDVKRFVDVNHESLWEEYKRDLNPQIYPVDLSRAAYNHKLAIIDQVREDVKKLSK